MRYVLASGGRRAEDGERAGGKNESPARPPRLNARYHYHMQKPDRFYRCHHRILAGRDPSAGRRAARTAGLLKDRPAGLVGPTASRSVAGDRGRWREDLPAPEIPRHPKPPRSMPRAEAVSLGGSMVTVHGSGARRWLQAGRRGSPSHPLILGLCDPDELDDAEVQRVVVGLPGTTGDKAVRLAGGRQSGASVVSSPRTQEIDAIEPPAGRAGARRAGTPPRGSEAGDSAERKRRCGDCGGADYIVVGPSITR